MRDWLQRRIDGLVDSLFGLLIVMGAMSLSIPLLARVATLAAVPLGLYCLLRAASFATRRAQPSEAMVQIETSDPAPLRVVEASYAFRDAFRQLPTSEDDGTGRNDPCWCGSGKRYKKCHGA